MRRAIVAFLFVAAMLISAPTKVNLTTQLQACPQPGTVGCVAASLPNGQVVWLTLSSTGFSVANGVLSVIPQGPAFTVVDAETPAGTVDGTNVTFTLAHAPNPPTSLHFFYNGSRLSSPGDYSLAGAVITMVTTPQANTPPDVLVATYRF